VLRLRKAAEQTCYSCSALPFCYTTGRLFTWTLACFAAVLLPDVGLLICIYGAALARSRRQTWLPVRRRIPGIVERRALPFAVPGALCVASFVTSLRGCRIHAY